MTNISVVEQYDDSDNPRFDLQQMLKEIEAENPHRDLRNVKQSEIMDLFKKKNEDKGSESP
jgi:hypothetical protein